MNCCLVFLVASLLAAVFAAEDPCGQPALTGPCKAAISRYFFNSATKRCEQFTYGGCGGNDNNFATQGDCETRCGCTVKGVFVAIGQSYMDDCNTCHCAGNNQGACTLMACLPTS